MISLCLQCCPLDQDAALELTQLICDIEPEKRSDTEFFLVYRKDCPVRISKEFQSFAARKFDRSAARMARNHDVGHPAGANMLAASAFIEMSILRREGLCKNEAFLIFEPDCLPMRHDWIDLLSNEWERVKALGKEAFGHWHQVAGPETLHMNGNAVFQTDFFDKYPNRIVGPGLQGWDYFYREQFVAMSTDSNLIFQQYNTYGISFERICTIEKNGVRPAFLHGIKTPDGRAHVRQMLLGNPLHQPA
jgi:hypothetical protein